MQWDNIFSMKRMVCWKEFSMNDNWCVPLTENRFFLMSISTMFSLFRILLLKLFYICLWKIYRWNKPHDNTKCVQKKCIKSMVKVIKSMKTITIIRINWIRTDLSEFVVEYTKLVSGVNINNDIFFDMIIIRFCVLQLCTTNENV